MNKATRISLHTLNPFFYIQTRKLFLWFILIVFFLSIQSLLINWLTAGAIFNNIQDLDFADPIYENLFDLISITIILFALDRQATIRKINTKQIIGKLPKSYQWLPFIVIIIFKLIFTQGSYRISYYLSSFIAPQWVETNLTTNIFTEVSESSIPFFCFALSFVDIFANEFLYLLVFEGIILHRWAIKWGNAKSILAISLLYGFLGYENFINSFITGIILCLLYIKSRTLITPMIFRSVSILISLIVESYYFFIIQSNSNSLLEQLRSEVNLGMILLAISTPYIIWWIYKNWLKKNEELPYFANALSETSPL
jgi:uncharacterized protein